MKKLLATAAFLLVLLAISAYLALGSFDDNGNFYAKQEVPAIEVPNSQSETAKMIVLSARDQIGIVTEYSNDYFQANEIPENGGACADVIWRAMKGIDIDMQKSIEDDIAKGIDDYPSSPPMDLNVNFRRVKILRVFLEKYAQKLPIEIVPYDIENLQNWQGGDIVTFAQLPSGLEHIAIVSDKRRADGVPLLIHNYGRGALEDDFITNWPSAITGHYRYP